MLKLGRFYKPNENDLHTNRKQMINSRFNFYFYNAVQRRASNANLRKKTTSYFQKKNFYQKCTNHAMQCFQIHKKCITKVKSLSVKYATIFALITAI